MSYITEKERREAELANWRDRAEWAERELRRVQVEIAVSAVERQQQLNKEESERRTAERKAAEDAAAEQQRVDSWFYHRLEEAVAGGDAAFTSFLSGDLERHRRNVPAGWAPGASPAVPAVDVALDDTPADDASQTALWAAVRRHGVTPPGYKPKRTPAR